MLQARNGSTSRSLRAGLFVPSSCNPWKPQILIHPSWKEGLGAGAEVQIGDEHLYLGNIILRQGNDSWLIPPGELASWELSKYCPVTRHESSACSEMMGILCLCELTGVQTTPARTTSAQFRDPKPLDTPGLQVRECQWVFHLFGSCPSLVHLSPWLWQQHTLCIYSAVSGQNIFTLLAVVVFWVQTYWNLTWLCKSLK